MQTNFGIIKTCANTGKRKKTCAFTLERADSARYMHRKKGKPNSAIHHWGVLPCSHSRRFLGCSFETGGYYLRMLPKAESSGKGTSEVQFSSMPGIRKSMPRSSKVLLTCAGASP